MNIIQRKPWRARHSPFVPFTREHFTEDGTILTPLMPLWRAIPLYLWNQMGNVIDWLRHAHDCQDPRIGCSCQGSYRFPHPDR